MVSPNFGVQDWSRIGIAPFPLYSQMGIALVAGNNYILGNASLASVAVPASTSTQVTFIANVACRVDIFWVDANPATFVATTPTKSFHVAANAALSGWSMPNRDSFLILRVVANTAGIGNLRVLTGVPPINQSSLPSAEGALLVATSIIPGNGVFSQQLAPFDGKAMLSANLNGAGAANDLIASITSVTFQGISAQQSQLVATQLTAAGGIAQIPPTEIYIPRYINTISFFNQNVAALTLQCQLLGIGENAA